MKPLLSSRSSSLTRSSFLSIATALLLSSFNGPMARAAGLIETFPYSNGNLTTVSGGTWQLWEPFAGNATVVNGAARFEGTTDVIRTFPAVLTAPGQTATFSFTLNVAAANTSEGYEIAFVPSSAPFNANTNYGSAFILQFDYQNAAAGMSSIQVVEGLGNGNTTLVDVGFMTTGVAHLIDVSLARGAANTAYSLFLDNNLLRSATFVLNDARAINALELDQASSTPSAIGSALIDDIRIVPEPAAWLMLAIGSIALLGFRRRQTPSLPDALPRSDRFRCGGRKSKFLAD